ncbi:putative primary replicative DNA helicase [Magnetofaba australis IT-1]|uniref:Replicative DNA helicase n=1 Tax=Magnetofaba australis IT-1 TaxID=1434232 RepID=A0A1Y2K084_9PROT|nr:putative primary replicative DNA helicase [Magnetofaba australis IT-1]
MLGAIMLDNGVMDQIADLLTPDDFYMGAHKVIFASMLESFERGEVVDVVLLKDRLEKSGELEGVGGPAYLAEILNTVPTAANAKSYARLVHDKSILRALSAEAVSIVEQVQAGDRRVEDVLDEAEQRIFQVSEGSSTRRASYHGVKDVLPAVFEKVEALMDDSRSVTGVSTGFLDLDKKLAGLQPSDLLILAGRPAMGKTALAMNIAANAALDHEEPVAVFSLEMSKEQLVMRLLASESRIDAQRLRTGHMQGDDYQKLTEAADRLAKAPIYIDDTPAVSITAMRAKCRRLKRERGIKLIVVDYLQLMRGATNVDNRVLEISQISQGLKAIAKELNVPVISLSQLSRTVESRTDKRPILSDLRESGSIEQDADVVMFVFREEYYKQDNPDLKGRAELIVAKQRNGPTGTVMLTFLNEHTRFENFASEAMGGAWSGP